MIAQNKSKRFRVGCYIFFSLCFFILNTISLILNDQISISQVLMEVLFISTFGYGLIGLITMQEQYIQLFLKLIFLVIAVIVYHLFALILSLINFNPEFYSENSDIIYVINIFLILLILLYVSVTLICIKYSQELVTDIRNSQDRESQMIELQTQIVQHQLDIENSYYIQSNLTYPYNCDKIDESLDEKSY